MMMIKYSFFLNFVDWCFGFVLGEDFFEYCFGRVENDLIVVIY